MAPPAAVDITDEVEGLELSLDVSISSCSTVGCML